MTLQAAVTGSGTSEVGRLWKSCAAFTAGVSCIITADTTTTGRQEAAERIHVVYEGDETKGH